MPGSDTTVLVRIEHHLASIAESLSILAKAAIEQNPKIAEAKRPRHP